MKQKIIYLLTSFAFCFIAKAQPVSKPGTAAFITGPTGYIQDIKAVESSPENIRFKGPATIVDQFYTDRKKKGFKSYSEPAGALFDAENPMRATAQIKPIDPKNVVNPAEFLQQENLTTQSPAYVGLGNQFNGLDPSDAQIAAGPNHLVLMSNADVRILNKQTGQIISQSTLSAFFSWSGFVFDPRVFYDPYGGRFVALALKNATNNCSPVDSKFRILISNNSDPTQGWFYYEVDVDGTNTAWLDFAMLGFNKDYICVAGNTLCGVVPGIFAFPKAAVYAGGGLTYYFWNPIYQAAPAFTYDNSLDRLYLVKTGNSNTGGSGYVDSWYISGTPVPSLFANYSFGTSPWGAFASDSAHCPKQLGGVSTFTAVNIFGHGMLSNCVYRNGLLWFTHAVFLPATGATTRTSTQWWSVNPATGAVSQVGRIDDASGNISEYYASIGVNNSSDAVVTYSIMSSIYYQGAAFNFRNSSDGSGAMPNSLFYYGGGANDPDGRGGDYSQCAMDPLDDKAIWVVNQLPTTSTWETRFTVLPGYYGCYTDVTFSNFPWSGVTKNEASSTITSAEMIQPSSMVDYDAGNGITLTPGFNAIQGCVFKAYINGCSGAKVPNPRYEEQFANEELAEKIISNEAGIDFMLYPNPSSDYFNLKYSIEETSNVSIKIFDSKMNLVYVVADKSLINEGTYTHVIDMSQFAAGLYFCKIESNGKVQTRKMQRLD